jgi:hypothetical protein
MGSSPVVSAPTVIKPAVSISVVSKRKAAKPAASKTGRHRRRPSAKVVVRGSALTSYRLALLGTLALLLVASAVFLTLS